MIIFCANSGGLWNDGAYLLADKVRFHLLIIS